MGQRMKVAKCQQYLDMESKMLSLGVGLLTICCSGFAEIHRWLKICGHVPSDPHS